MDKDIFGFGGDTSNDDVTPPVDKTNDTVTDIDSGKTGNKDTDKTDIDTPDNTPDNNGNDDPNHDKQGDDDTKSDLVEGQIVETDDGKYTVDKDGNLVDEKGNIFKEAKDVKEWIESFDKVDNTSEDLSMDAIQTAVGIEITDENDKPIVYENTPAGVKAYIDAVVETAREDHYTTAINTLYQKYPIIEDVINYYVANGNSLDGFGEMPDRSNITIDDTNEAQQEEIIRMAWTESKRKGDVNSYISYLKSSGILLATAKEELTALQESDAERKLELQKEAERVEAKNIKELQDYWKGVEDAIKARKLCGYTIPETVVINKDGQKLSATPTDFFNYLYRVDNDGKSAYQRDLAKQTPETRRDDEILRAYLMFTGGSYSDLVNMAINDKNVQTLRLRARERKTNSVRISNAKPANKQTKDVDFGF